MRYKFHRVDYNWPEHNMARYGGPSGEVEADNAFAAWQQIKREHCPEMKFSGMTVEPYSRKITAVAAKTLGPETGLGIWSGKLLFRVYPA